MGCAFGGITSANLRRCSSARRPVRRCRASWGRWSKRSRSRSATPRTCLRAAREKRRDRGWGGGHVRHNPRKDRLKKYATRYTPSACASYRYIWRPACRRIDSQPQNASWVQQQRRNMDLNTAFKRQVPVELNTQYMSSTSLRTLESNK